MQESDEKFDRCTLDDCGRGVRELSKEEMSQLRFESILSFIHFLWVRKGWCINRLLRNGFVKVSYLNEDRKQDHGQRGRNEHLARRDHAGQKHLDQGEAHGTSQSSVSHDKLFLQIDRLEPESIGDSCQQEHA